MDRIVSDEERIRRAEDVLERRKNMDLRISSDNFVKEKSTSKVKKIFIQCLICLTIYCGFYYAKKAPNGNGVFENIKSTLKEDVNFKSVYDCLIAKFNECKNFMNKENKEQQNQEENNSQGSEKVSSGTNEEDGSNINEGKNVEEGNNQDNNLSDNIDENNLSSEKQGLNDPEAMQDTANENMGIGGEADSISDIINISDENQMTVDANFVCSNIEFMNPLDSGIVTSNFGEREATNIISKNHKGIDLGAKTGSTIVAACDGKVVEASSQGDFGVHLKIQNGDIVTIYGHCSKLYVKVGDEVKKGQKIADVGATGKATGPHLHFEIRRENRPIDPVLIIDF